MATFPFDSYFRERGTASTSVLLLFHSKPFEPSIFFDDHISHNVRKWTPFPKQHANFPLHRGAEISMRVPFFFGIRRVYWLPKCTCRQMGPASSAETFRVRNLIGAVSSVNPNPFCSKFTARIKTLYFSAAPSMLPSGVPKEQIPFPLRAALYPFCPLHKL